jgi:cyclase
MDADGTQRGFDCELTATISTVVHIPVIASGGAVGPQHFAEVSCGALPAPHWPLQSSTTGSTPSAASKEYLRLQDVPVRLD